MVILETPTYTRRPLISYCSLPGASLRKFCECDTVDFASSFQLKLMTRSSKSFLLDFTNFQMAALENFVFEQASTSAMRETCDIDRRARSC